jgi:hypothetical protein
VRLLDDHDEPRRAWGSAPKWQFTAMEIKLLDRFISDKPGANARRRPLSAYLTKLPRLGGYLARTNDPPPGNMIVWRVLSRRTDITLVSSLLRTMWVIESLRRRLPKGGEGSYSGTVMGNVSNKFRAA